MPTIEDINTWPVEGRDGIGILHVDPDQRHCAVFRRDVIELYDSPTPEGKSIRIHRQIQDPKESYWADECARIMQRLPSLYDEPDYLNWGEGLSCDEIAHRTGLGRARYLRTTLCTLGIEPTGRRRTARRGGALALYTLDHIERQCLALIARGQQSLRARGVLAAIGRPAHGDKAAKRRVIRKRERME